MKSHTIAILLLWKLSSSCSRLQNDFEFNPAMCLQRNTVYCCYVQFCREQNISPANQAIFGKVGYTYISSVNSNLLHHQHLFPLLRGSMFCTFSPFLFVVMMENIRKEALWQLGETEGREYHRDVQESNSGVILTR